MTEKKGSVAITRKYQVKSVLRVEDVDEVEGVGLDFVGEVLEHGLGVDESCDGLADGCVFLDACVE